MSHTSIALLLALAPVQATSSPQPAEPTPLVVAITSASDCHAEIAGRPVTNDQLASLAKTADKDPPPVQVEVDARTPYRCVSRVIHRLRLAGFKEVAVGTESPAR